MLTEKSYGFVLWGVPRFRRSEAVEERNLAEGRRAMPRADAIARTISRLKAAEFAKVEACLSAT